jgi:hypothetical protein
MKNLFLTILLAAATFSACTASSAERAAGGDQKSGAKPQAGDTVLYKASATAYSEGKVEKVEGGKYEIRSGNNIAKADAADVYAMPKDSAKPDVKAGDYAVAFSREIYWTGGEVKSASDDFIEIQTTTGEKLNVAPGKVIKVSPAATADIKNAVFVKAFEDLGKTKKPVLPANWKPKAGEKVAAQWSFGSWHVAVIKHVNANNIDIDWQNGWSDGTVARDKVAPYPNGSNAMPKTGDYVIIKPQSDISEWKFATVTRVDGNQAEVKFADGKTQKVGSADFIALS